MTIILWLVAAAFLFACLLARWNARRLVAAAAAWPTVTGRIIDVDVRQNGNGTYAPQISYAYAVDDHGYASERLRPGGTPFFYSQRKTIALAAAFAPGAPVVVHHHPRKPRRAAIDLVPLSHAQWLFGALAATTGAIAILVSVG
jgi:hypothetical protein